MERYTAKVKADLVKRFLVGVLTLEDINKKGISKDEFDNWVNIYLVKGERGLSIKSIKINREVKRKKKEAKIKVKDIPHTDLKHIDEFVKLYKAIFAEGMAHGLMIGGKT